MGEKEFINRTQDFSNMETIISTSSSEEALAIIIYAPSGYGKSKFVEEFFKRQCGEYTKIKVPCHLGKNQVANDLEFVANFYGQLYQEKPPAVTEKLSMRNATGEFSTYGISFSLPTLLSPDIAHSSKALMMIDFIKKRLSQGKYIIDFENFQKIDQESFELLKEILSVHTDNIFLFEYTVSDLTIENRKDVVRMQEILNNYLVCDLYELHALDKNALKTICKIRNIDYRLAEEYFFTGETQGDLYTVITLQHAVIKKKNDIPLNNIPLSKEEKLILYIVLLNQNKIKEEELFEIFSQQTLVLAGNNKFSVLYICEIINKLSVKELIIEKNYEIWIYHDKIIDLYDLSKQDVILWNAYALLKEYYIKCIKEEVFDENILYRFIDLCCMFSDESILEYLPLIHKLLLSVKYPSILLKKVAAALSNALENIIDQSFLRNIYFLFIDICFDCGAFEEAMFTLNKITLRDFKWEYYHSSLIAVDDSDVSCENILKEYCQKYSKHNQALFFEMNLLSLYMRTKDYMFSKTFAYNLIKKYEGNTSVIYGCLLKNYTEYLDNDDAIEMLNKVDSIFTHNNRYDLAAMANITYASRLAYIGKIHLSKKKLEKCNTFLKKNRNYRMYYYLNNYSALCLLDGEINSNIISNFEKALLLVSNTYEKLIILCNLLIANLLSNNIREADKIFNEINRLEYSFSFYEELQHIIHYNFRYYYKRKNDLQNVKNEENILKILSEKESTPKDLIDYINATLNNKALAENHQWHYYSNFPYRVDFIGYWQMELNSNIESMD